jgi:5-methyltetrahydrofolate--homocysteine methyltransferase
MTELEQIAQAIQDGDDEAVAARTRRALDAGLPAKQILDDGLLAGMAVVGDKFGRHDIFLPDVLLAARALYAGLALIKPALEARDMASRGTVVLGSVQGDLHDIGKNLVAILLRGAGYEVIDLGHDVPPARFVDAAVEHRARIIGCSALLTTTMPVMRQVAELIRSRGLGGSCQLIVGGAPVNAAFAAEIGAAGYGFDAMKAVQLVNQLCGSAT